MVITLVFSSLLTMGINLLLQQGSQIFIFCLMVFLLLPMLGLPILVLQCSSQSTAKAMQQFLRVSAGPDELLIRELSDRRNNPTDKTNHSRINTE